MIIFVVAWFYSLILGKLRDEIAALGLPEGTAIVYDGVDLEGGILWMQ